MTQMDPYQRGHRDGLRFAVTWLHKRAEEMNDPKAISILNSAATNLGWEIEELLEAAYRKEEFQKDISIYE